MMEWKKFDGRTAPEKIDEDDLLILLDTGRIVHATHNAMEKNFYQAHDDHDIVYPYRVISFYCEIDWPDDGNPMISECEHGHILNCDQCAERHREATEYAERQRRPYRT